MTSPSGEPIRQLELNTLTGVPDSHAWTTLHDRPSGDDPVPVIDLEAPDAVRLIGRACEEWGSFQLIGHGVPVDLLHRLEAQARRLFALPTEQKLKAAARPGSYLHGGYGLAKISAFFSKIFWSEGYSVIGSPLPHALILWPDDHAEFCETIEEYRTLMRDLCRRLVRLMLRSLGLGEEDIDATGGLGGGEANVALQLNHYPCCPEPDRAVGLAEHTDSSLITALCQGAVSGLQLLHGGRWVTVPPIPGALVINLGDLFQIISNGRFKSVVHRALVNRSQSRISVAYFSGPPEGFEIKPLEKLIEPHRGPAFRAVTLTEFLSLKAKLYLKTVASLSLPAEKEEEETHAN